MKKLRKQAKAGMAVIAAAIAFLLPSLKKQTAERQEDPFIPTETPEEKAAFSEIRQPVSLADFQKLNSSVKYLLVFEDEEEERRIPVVEAQDSTYALSHDLLGKEEKAGTAFTDVSAYEPENLVIYGHSSDYRDVQFTFLKKMKDAGYYQAHPVFLMETEEGQFPCQIVSMGEYDLKQESTMTDWALPEYQNEAAVQQMFLDTRPYLLQHTDGIVYQGQQIITLVTCNMEEKGVRYVLQALRL